MDFKETSWIGLPRAEIEDKKIYHGDMNGRFTYFRHCFYAEKGAQLTINISANSRYRLWINGLPILSGPCRGDCYRHYYEAVDLSEYLKPGKNILAAQVLLCDSAYVPYQGDIRTPLVSVATLPAGHRLAVEGTLLNEKGEPVAEVTTGKANWKVFLDNSFYLTSEKIINDNMGAITEHIDFRNLPSDWKEVEMDDSDWRQAEIIEAVAGNKLATEVGFYLNYQMKERPIPLLEELDGCFTKEFGSSKFGDADNIHIKAGQKITFLFDGAELFNAYPAYQFEGGRDAKVTITYFECFSHPQKTVKRDDYLNGSINERGQVDTIILDGTCLTYEPFWYRTFRFVQIEIEAKEQPLVFARPKYRRTGYPLRPQSFIRSSEPWVEQLWDICVRTLQGCMMETYMDCPFWEQLQYTMDTRLQGLYTYMCSKDTLLIKKALDDFHCSMMPEGLVQGKAPSGFIQIISTFSLYYIYMLGDYYERTGDIEIVRRYRADMDNILAYYERQIGVSELIEQVEHWAFVDWQPEWQKTTGRPAALEKGPSTIINLMYGLALLHAADLNEASGRPGLAQEYRDRQATIAAKVQELCWDEKRGLYREGPEFEQYSQHAQSLAVLNDMLSKEEANKVMHRTMEQEDVLKCYFSTCHELFRACEKAGCYELTKKQMDWWIDLIDEGCTTCPETPKDARSECHAWSAQPMYELMAVIAGIRSKGVGYKEVIIQPHMEYLPDLQGEMITEQGMIEFSYERVNNRRTYHIVLPQQMIGEFIGPDGISRNLAAGENNICI